MFTIIFNPRPEGYGSSLVIHSFINPRPEGYGSRLVIHSFINPRPEGYGSRLVVRALHSFCHLELCSLLRHNEGTNKIAT